VLSFLPRAMEWHFFLATMTLLGFFYPWAFGVVAVGVIYTVGYGVACGKNVNLDVLLAVEPNPTWSRRLLWRTTIAYLHFIEPLARDWGRLKGGLTPWRSVVREALRRNFASPWWRRLAPVVRVVQWAKPGTMQLEKFAMLDLMTRKLGKRRCFVGWNPTTEDWDLKVGRGALAESRLRAVVEHHGGSWRTAKISAIVRPPELIRWTFWIMIALAVMMAWTGERLTASAILMLLAILWIAVIREANRLETVLLATADEVARELTENAEGAPGS